MAINMPIDVQEQGLTWRDYMEDKQGAVDVAWTISMCSGSQALDVVGVVYDLMKYDGNEASFPYALEKSWKFPEYYIPAFIRMDIQLLANYNTPTTLPFVVEADEQNEDYLVWKGAL